jgi:hypothetical protein
MGSDAKRYLEKQVEQALLMLAELDDQSESEEE